MRPATRVCPPSWIRAPLSSTRHQPNILSTFRSRPSTAPSSQRVEPLYRAFSFSASRRIPDYTARAKALHQKSADDHEKEFNSQIDNAIGEAKELQARTPWHREGSDLPPVKRNRSAGAMTKGSPPFPCPQTHLYSSKANNNTTGKLLTTPSRLLKLILPLTTLDKNLDRKSIEPLALLVHPQQPLSYLERLIQSELPMIKSKDGAEKVPAVHFRAEDSAEDEKLFSYCILLHGFSSVAGIKRRQQLQCAAEVCKETSESRNKV